MRGEKIKVLYITGAGRSGTTILANALGQIDGFFSVGEINYIWERNVLEGRPCGCGEAFRECSEWPRVLEEAYGGVDEVEARAWIEARDSGARTRHVPLMLTPWGSRWISSRLGNYLNVLQRLYRAIETISGSRVIVDSSKLPSYGYVLDLAPAIDLYVVHLVRDPRAVAHSWSRKKFQPDTGEYMEQYGAAQSSLIWNVWNSVIEALWRRRGRYLRVRYEDFVREPGATLERILALLREKDPLSFVNGRQVELAPTHNLSGNPNRFETGRVELKLDEEWRTKLKKQDRSLVTALTAPLLVKYGYLNSKSKAGP